MRISLAVKAVAIVLALTFILSSASFVAASEASSFQITDGKGHTVTFDEPVSNIVAVGKGTSATVVEVGCIEKIVVTDKYSTQGEEDVFRQLNTRVNVEHKATAGGSMYSSGMIDQMITEIIDATDSGKFDKNKDAIVISGGGDGPTNNVYDRLFNLGFKKVLVWTNIEVYDEIIHFVESVSMITTGSITDRVAQMRYTVNQINQVMKEKCLDYSMAFSIRWGSENWQVSNSGALASSMIDAAGGTIVTADPQRQETYITIEHPSQIIDEFGKDVVVFADATIVGDKMVDLRNELGNDVKIVPMKSLWNNYCPDSIEGVWTMACAMHPDYFQGDVPEVSGKDTNYLPYFISGIVATLILVGVVYYFMKHN